MKQKQPARIGRRLAAIVAADVAGYSRLMGLDEVGTARTLREHRKVTDALVAKHGGRLVKTTGDGVLLEFPSVVDAVECAVAVQAVMAERNQGVPEDRRMLFRIGINLGDILIEGDDILGDGVNVAARLEGIAEPGGICISSSAYEQVRGKVSVGFADLGEQRLKNIDRPVRAYAAKTAGHPRVVAPDVTSRPEAQKPLPLPDKPSVAVLPFQNMSGDPEQEYFADGIAEDIITALSRFKSLFVIARNSSFTYKGKAVDIKQVGRELGVRYVLEGSVRKSAGKVRITGQLIDSATGAHVWADRFDGKLEDVFELQDQITTSVVGELMTNVQAAEIERANRKPTANLDAYDCYWRGVAQHVKYTKSGTDAALAYFRKATELDETFASAYSVAGVVYAVRKQNLWMLNVAQETAEAIRLARCAIELDEMDEAVLCRSGFVLAYFAGELDLGANCTRRGLAINPNFAVGWQLSAWVQIYLGNHQTALEHIRQTAFFDRIASLGLKAGTDLSTLLDGLCAKLSFVSYVRPLLGQLSRANVVGLSASLPIITYTSQASDELQRSIVDATAQIDELREKNAALKLDLERAMREKVDAETEQASLQQKIENTEFRIHALRAGWRVLGGDRPWTNEALADLSTQLLQENSELLLIEELTDQAEHLIEAAANLDEISKLETELAPIEAERNRLTSYALAAEAAQNAYSEMRQQHVRRQMEEFVRVISALFTRMQSNEVYDRISEGDASAPLSWRAISEDFAMNPDLRFSQGQRQDFALSIFLARARGLGGTFFLDEPLIHLDDLNRVALLDVFRAICLENSDKISIVLTTASKPTLRHFVEKFSRASQTGQSEHAPLLRVIHLEGNPRVGVSLSY